MRIAPALAIDLDDLRAMRIALWPDSGSDDLTSLTSPSDSGIVLICRIGNAPAGFAEIGLRRDYVNGCETSPVAFLEGIYVIPTQRRRGIARLMIAAAEEWARQKSCKEFASDAALENQPSHLMHRALGFAETQRVVYFRKVLA
jgi:aminoglycoside 6'-N-acetyltransferase I